MVTVLILVLALVVDLFVASISYGARGIRIPPGSAAVVSAVGTVFFGAALWLGEWISSRLPVRSIQLVCISVLFCMGLFCLFEEPIKRALARRCSAERRVRFHVGKLQFVLDIYLDETRADADNSKVLSLQEALLLGVTFSVDSLLSGVLGAVFVPTAVWVLLCCFLLHMLAIFLGVALGKRFGSRFGGNLSWLGGGLFILLAVSKLVQL